MSSVVKRITQVCLLVTLMLAVTTAAPSEVKAQTPPVSKPDRPQETKPKTRKKPNEKAGEARTQKPNSSNQKRPAPVSKKRIDELFKFVKNHHREILPLLKKVRNDNPSQFQVAMRSLDREVKLLNSLPKKSARRERSLELWVTRSKTKLLAAKVATAQSNDEAKELKKQLRQLIAGHYDSRLQNLKDDRDLARQRVDKLDQHLTKLKANRSNEIQRQIDAFTRSAQKMKQNRTPNKKSDK